MHLLDYLRGRKPKGFTPHAYYSPEGDFLTVYVEGVPCHAETLADGLEVYRAVDGRAVGVKVKGVGRLVDAGRARLRSERGEDERS